ncbi:MAG: NAD-dependent deacetylase [Epsilonproteobacteria bacterium]|nr:MAG: NAD-dependent deacetylase [Campylobacterota bacterium]
MDNMQQAKDFIKEADAILITSGAGMGVDSGLPDFRGTKGFWKAYPPIEKLGLSFSDIANPKWFKENPPLAWAFYGHMLNLYRDTTPHDGFNMLLDLVKEKNNNYFIYTSNIDGQFQKAGFKESKICEVHGSIHYLQCSQISHNTECNNIIWDAKNESIDVDMDKFKALNLPLCNICGDIARPNILMFGDWGWNYTRSEKQENRYDNWIKSVKTKNQKLVIIEIGAGLDIPTIRLHNEALVNQYSSAKLIRINPQDFHIQKRTGISIPFGGLEGLKKIFKEFNY